MVSRVVMWTLLAALSLLGSRSQAFAAPLFRGFSYTPWQKDALLGAGSDQSILNMKADGVDAVALNVWWFQDDERSDRITEDFTRYSASLESVRHAIRFLHANGMKVLLKPMVDCRNGVWRGRIRPSPSWFAGYQGFITLWAGIAEQEGVETFSIGCELSMTQSWAREWRRIAAAVREVYHGPLTYAANHGSEQAVQWWDAVDFIGIDAYYALTIRNDPTARQLDRAWASRRDRIAAWRKSRWPAKQVIFTEVGYRSVDGANRSPWDYTSKGKLDLQEQADCYGALFSALWDEPWWGGAFLWNWETDPEAGGALDPGYTPQHKPAEQVLRSYYLRP